MIWWCQLIASSMLFNVRRMIQQPALLQRQRSENPLPPKQRLRNWMLEALELDLVNNCPHQFSKTTEATALDVILETAAVTHL